MSTQKVTGFFIPKLKYFNPNYEPLPWKISPDEGEALSRLSTHKKKPKNKSRVVSPNISRSKSTIKSSPRPKSTTKTSPRSKSSTKKTSKSSYVSPKTSPSSKSSNKKSSSYVSPKESPRSVSSTNSSPNSMGSPSFSPVKKKYKTSKETENSPTRRSISPTKGKISNEKRKELIEKFWDIQDKKMAYKDLNTKDREEMKNVRIYMKKKMLEKLESIDVSKTNLGKYTSRLMKDKNFLYVFMDVATKDEYYALMENPYDDDFLQDLDEVGSEYYKEVYVDKGKNGRFYLDALNKIKDEEKKQKIDANTKSPIEKIQEKNIKPKSSIDKRQEENIKPKSSIDKKQEENIKPKSSIEKLQRKRKSNDEIKSLINKYWDLRNGEIVTDDLSKEEIDEMPKIQKYVKKKIMEKLKSIDARKYHLGSYTSSLLKDDVFIDIFSDIATKDEYIALMSNIYDKDFSESLNDFGFNYYNAVYLGQGNDQEYYQNLLKKKNKKLYKELKNEW